MSQVGPIFGCVIIKYIGTVVTDATYWTERVEATRVRVLKNFVGFGTWRACNFPIIPVDVIPREVVEILATLALHTAKSTSSLRLTDPLLLSG